MQPDQKGHPQDKATGARDTANDAQTDGRTASQKEEAERTDPKRTHQRPEQTAEVPLGTGNHSEPPGGGGRESQRVSADKPKRQ